MLRCPIKICTHFWIEDNMEKPKIIQIGGLRTNRMKSYNNKELIWTSEFKSLGITFKVNGMKDITITNMEKKLIEIDKIMAFGYQETLIHMAKLLYLKV